MEKRKEKRMKRDEEFRERSASFLVGQSSQWRDSRWKTVTLVVKVDQRTQTHAGTRLDSGRRDQECQETTFAISPRPSHLATCSVTGWPLASLLTSRRNLLFSLTFKIFAYAYYEKNRTNIFLLRWQSKLNQKMCVWSCSLPPLSLPHKNSWNSWKMLKKAYVQVCGDQKNINYFIIRDIY